MFLDVCVVWSVQPKTSLFFPPTSLHPSIFQDYLMFYCCCTFLLWFKVLIETKLNSFFLKKFLLLHIWQFLVDWLLAVLYCLSNDLSVQRKHFSSVLTRERDWETNNWHITNNTDWVVIIRGVMWCEVRRGEDPHSLWDSSIPNI